MYLSSFRSRSSVNKRVLAGFYLHHSTRYQSNSTYQYDCCANEDDEIRREAFRAEGRHAVLQLIGFLKRVFGDAVKLSVDDNVRNILDEMDTFSYN